MKELTFDSLPNVVAELKHKVDVIYHHILGENNSTENDEDRLFDLDELQKYLPEKPAKATVYGWINFRKVPFKKHGRRLYFQKSEIDNWLANGRQMS